MSDRKPLFIDFEASSLEANSYPIEVAYSDPAGGPAVSHLINPYCVDDWTDWDPYAQMQIHGLSRSELSEKGVHPRAVALEMNQRLAGRDVFCDALVFDTLWRDRLFDAAGVKPRFVLKDSAELFHRAIEELGPRQREVLGLMADDLYPEGIVANLSEKAREMVGGKQHRAAVDVAYLESLYALATGARRVPDQDPGP